MANIGQRFGRLTVTGFGDKPSRLVCQCDCGRTHEVAASNIARTSSCGCIRQERNNHTTHGATGTLTHKRWRAMKARCLNPNADNYARYGGAGVTVCERWLDFPSFLTDMGECPDPSMTIDRIKGSLGYEPGNCRWATKVEQARNTKSNRMLTFAGETLNVSACAEKTGLPPILNRLRYGWTVERTLTEAGDARASRQPRAK